VFSFRSRRGKRFAKRETGRKEGKQLNKKNIVAGWVGKWVKFDGFCVHIGQGKKKGKALDIRR